MEFDKAFSFILQFEGGYVNDPQDPGGETKFGISKRAYPYLDIQNLTPSEAKDIYRRDFWDRLRLDTFPPELRLAIFDSAVNCGVGNAVKFLQAAVHTDPDGMLGPATMRNAQAAYTNNKQELIADIMWWRFQKVSELHTFSIYGKGWVRRMMKVIANSQV